MRRTLLLAALAVAAPLFLAPAVDAHPNVHARELRHAQVQVQVRRLVADARRDGVITRPERRAISRALARRDALMAQVRHHSRMRRIG